MTSTGGAFCSGFLVGPDLLLTNQHCISSNSRRMTKPNNHLDIPVASS
jgi:V8-like Glu-specific endopeptidase